MSLINSFPGSDISGKADKVSSATNGNFAGLDSNGNLTDSGSKASDFLTSHQDISGKADKVTSATNGHFAGLDSNGNLTDSGKSASDFLSGAYLEQTVTLSTSATTTVTFSDASILATSLIDLAVSEWGTVPDDVTVSAGTCTVTMPQVDSAHSVTVRIYVR